MIVYTIALPKGGGGKTAAAAELVWALVQAGLRVLAIDLDQQGNLSARMGITPDTELAGTTAEVIDASVEISDAAEPAPSLPGAHILVGAHDLTALEQAPPADLVTSLRDMLPAVADRWDAVVIDTPPNVGGLTLAGLAAADHVVAPVQAATEAYDQVERLEATIAERIARRVRPGQRVAAFIPTMVDRRRLLDREVLTALEERFGDRVTPPIRQGVAVRDAYTAGMTVSAYDPRSAVAQDFRAAMDHLLTTTRGAARA